MLKLIKTLLFVILLNVSVEICVSESVELTIKQGVLSGLIEKTLFQEKSYVSFKGIPYAKIPTGELRFMPPAAHDGWEGTLQAQSNKPTCLQFSSRMRMGERFGISGSEDCLYVNIFTPSLDGALPIVVFDYTDNLRSGFNGTETYSPDFFLEEEVIVVTVSHRLGLFGYLTTEDDVIPGNYGIKDFIFALQWIQNNIAKFGGDPERVTLMGNRGGAVMIDILLRTEKAKGLFSGVIMQSGTALETVFFPKHPKEKAFKLGEVFDIKTNDSTVLLQELQKLDALEIMLKEHHVLDGRRQEERFQINVYPFSPTIESDNVNSVVTSLPEETKVVNDVPILIGFNTREGLDLAAPYLAEPKFVQEMGNELIFYFPIRRPFRFDTNSTVYAEALSEVKKFYLRIGYLSVENILEYSVYIADIFHTYAKVKNIRQLVNDITSPIFHYVFDFRGALNENSEFLSKRTRLVLGNRGATVCDELCYQHLCTRIQDNYLQLRKLTSEQPEIKVLKKTVRMWTNFAKTRNPTPDTNDVILKNIKWDPIDRSSKDVKYLHMSRKMVMKTNPFEDRMQFWDNFLEKYSKMVIDGVVTKEDVLHEEL